MDLKPANDLLLYFDGQNTVALLSKKKRKYILKNDYLHRLSDWSKGICDSSKLDKIDQELLKNGFLTADLEHYDWQGDRESLFAHFTIRDYSLTPDRLISRDSIKTKLLDFSKDKLIPENFRHDLCLDLVELPNASFEDIPNISLKEALQSRMTCRDFKNESCSSKILASLLHVNFQWENRHGLENLSKNDLAPLSAVFRTSPSATGLQMHEVFIGILNVDSIESGIYHYRQDAEKQTLQKVSHDFNDEILIKATRGQDWAKGLSFVIFLVTDMRKMWVKTKTAKGYGVAYLEAGHISQNIQLVSSALGLNTWITGSFFDHFLEKILAIDRYSFLFCPFLVGVGYSYPSRVAKVFC